MSTQQTRRDPQEIESDINRTRARIDDTLQDLEEKLSPQQLLNDAFSYLRHGGANDFFASLGCTVKQNPLPVALTSISLGWLIVSSSQRDTQRQGHSPISHGQINPGAQPLTNPRSSSHAPTTAMTGTSERSADHRGKTHRAKEKAMHMKENMHARTERLRERSQSAVGGVSHRAQSAGTQVSRFVHDYPFVAGTLGFALGAALGGLLPATRTEDRHSNPPTTPSGSPMSETSSGTPPSDPSKDAPPADQL